MDFEEKLSQVTRKRKAGSSGPKGKKRRFNKAPAVLRLRQSEKKCVDTSSANLNCSSAYPQLLCNGLVPGTGSNNRVGRKISMRSISLRGWIFFAQAGTTPTADFMRLVLVYDRQPNGALPAFADVFQDTNQAGTTNTDSLSNVNINNADRFKIIKEFVWASPGAAAAAAYSGINEQRVLELKAFIKLNALETHYNAGTAGTVADITTGSLFLMAAGLNGAADYQYRIKINARLRYADL